MSNKNLTIRLTRKLDKSGQTFYIGKLKGDLTLNCKDGVAFLIFTSELDSEELQIAPMDIKDARDNKEADY